MRLTAPPERGKVNKALIDLLAGLMGLPGSKIRIVRCLTSQVKHVQLDGLTDQQALELLGLS